MQLLLRGLRAGRFDWNSRSIACKRSLITDIMADDHAHDDVVDRPPQSHEASEIYEKAEAYWASIPCDLNGMLGGFAHLNSPDIADSKRFIARLKTKKMLKSFEKAVDCGCGIGRVTKNLLLPLFSSVDMVDVTESFIESSKIFIGEKCDGVGRKFVCGLQDFEPANRYYDLIWVQWVTGHLTDNDFVAFFRRCKEGLREDGCIVLKENVTSSSNTYDFDEDDNSWTRPKSAILRLLRDAGLSVISEKKQQNFPDGMLPVYMFAVK